MPRIAWKTVGRSCHLARWVSSSAAPRVPPKAPETVRRVSLATVRKWRKENRPIAMMTAYDYPSAVHADLAQMDIVLVGDSVAMVELGHETTQRMTVDEMLHHCRAVANGAKRPLLVGDMPFGSYEVSVSEALRTAFRFVKEGNMSAVKLEGGGKHQVEVVRRVVDSGIAVMGHTGLTPQSVSALGGFRPQGRTSTEATRILDECRALQDAGAFAIVLECVPAKVASVVTQALEVPTIGIGAGRGTSGQVLVYHDMLGMLQHPHHAKVTPRFCKRYAEVGLAVQAALEAYGDEVRQRTFPSDAYEPYSIPDVEWDHFQKHVSQDDSLTPPRPTSLRDEGDEQITVY